MVNQYTMLQVLGQGAFGKVKKCQDQAGTEFAVKQLKKSMLKRKRFGRFGSALDNVKKEIAIWKKLRHPHLVKLFEVMDDPEQDKIYMVSELVSGGAVMGDVLECDPMPEERARRLFLQCVIGLEFLHTQDIVHRDIKPGNILVTDADVVKLADFGVSQFFEDGDDAVKNTVGTAAFMAPEMLTKGAFRAKQIDVWALGATLFMLVFGNPPFVGKTLAELNEKILTEELHIPDKPAVSDDLKALLGRMLRKDPSERLWSLSEIRKEPWCAAGTASMLVSNKPEDQVKVEVTADEIENAISPVLAIDHVVKAKVASMKLVNFLKRRHEAHTIEEERNSDLQEDGSESSMAAQDDELGKALKTAQAEAKRRASALAESAAGGDSPPADGLAKVEAANTSMADSPPSVDVLSPKPGPNQTPRVAPEPADEQRLQPDQP